MAATCGSLMSAKRFDLSAMLFSSLLGELDEVLERFLTTRALLLLSELAHELLFRFSFDFVFFKFFLVL